MTTGSTARAATSRWTELERLLVLDVDLDGEPFRMLNAHLGVGIR